MIILACSAVYEYLVFLSVSVNIMLTNLPSSPLPPPPRKLQEEFRGFLQQPVLRECLETNRKTVYELIASHGAVEDMVFFATLMKGLVQS